MRVIRRLLHIVKLLVRLNIVKTIYFNYKTLPFKQAIKLPFFIYGKIYLWDLSGTIELPHNIYSGMIKIGYKWHDLWPLSFLPNQFQIRGKVVFQGKCLISGGVNINVQRTDAILTLGDSVMIGGGSVVKCLKSIRIDSMTGLTGNCTIMDSNMHYIKNIETGVVPNHKGTIFIGKNCWLNYGTTVTKGSVVPDYSITSKNSYVSKDFSEYGTNLFLVGAPCKVANTKVQRIFTEEKQVAYRDYYDTHIEPLILAPGIEEETGHREGF